MGREIFIVWSVCSNDSEIEAIFDTKKEAEKYVKYLIDNDGDVSFVVSYTIQKQNVYSDAGKALNIY